ncbi:uncharacterized protein TNIN_240201 [Trichonephila inaurata madagascariensis]|uniref:Uncharacterized protein n=1 Tax=Trichonephila inaurata madagascariensis TaxID=2747483 RepID=A0A8X6YDJ0_9ARAC|nr:uncharacterized protein TNIN_240201 [Trichonephila inaurata madagascariensis]
MKMNSEIQIIENYRVTSDYEWLEFKAEIGNQIQKSVFLYENNNSIDSFDDPRREIDITVEEEDKFCFETKKNYTRIIPPEQVT